MGFKSVYRCLQEIFPEMDTRILKAVAIEHSKDADAAVNDILTEVLPYMARQSIVCANSPRVEIEENCSLLQPHPAAEVSASAAEPSTEPGSTVCEVADDSSWTNGTLPVDIAHLNEVDDAEPSSERRCIAVENAENSGRTNGATHAEDAGLASEPRFFVGENVENSACTGKKCTSVENAETDGCVNGAAHSELTHLNEVIDAGLAPEARFVVGENAEDSARPNGVFLTNIMPRKVVCERGMGSFRPLEPKCTAVENAENIGLTKIGPHSDLSHLDGVVEAWPYSEAVIEDSVKGSRILNDIDNQLGSNSMDEELILLGKTYKMKNVELCQNSTSLPHEKDGRLNGLDHVWKDLDYYSTANGVDQGTHEGSCKLDACVDGSTECNLPFESHFDPPVHNFQELQANGSLNLTSRADSSVCEMGTIEDDLTSTSIVTQSDQICRIDFLDEIIEDAKNNKKILFSAMESVINMMKEVELQERAAEQAKEEATKGGLDILVKVEELRHMLGHAKGTNDMHAGEVYGEKAILATEAKELQSRLLCLSDERDKALATLDEMCQTLQTRLAAAEEMKKAAEQERLEKEGSAHRALAEQEAIMDKVVQESKLLEKEAEENSKLREFLVDRGLMVDMLQGEISVICQDVGLLKEKFDKRLPLSMSVSSSQTSCKLASSSSSQKSMASGLVSEERESPKSPEKGSPVSPTSDRSIAEEDKKVESDDRELLEDGWDIFDKDAELDVEAPRHRISDRY